MKLIGHLNLTELNKSKTAPIKGIKNQTTLTQNKNKTKKKKVI